MGTERTDPSNSRETESSRSNNNNNNKSNRHNDDDKSRTPDLVDRVIFSYTPSAAVKMT